MRPSDENQATSMRPNLMSASLSGASRGSEDSILAKLERDLARRQGSAAPLRLVWYAASALVAVGLTAMLVWLAADNGQQPRLARAAVTAVVAPPPASDVVGVPIPDAGAAALVDESQPPPLRLLEPAKSIAPIPRPAPAARVNRPSTPAAKRAPPARAGQARPAAANATRIQRPQAPARTRPGTARAAARPAVRIARTAAPMRPAEQPVDSDVALISAVIVYANGHPEATTEDAAACAADTCRARQIRP